MHMWTAVERLAQKVSLLQMDLLVWHCLDFWKCLLSHWLFMKLFLYWFESCLFSALLCPDVGTGAKGAWGWLQRAHELIWSKLLPAFVASFIWNNKRSLQVQNAPSPSAKGPCFGFLTKAHTAKCSFLGIRRKTYKNSLTESRGPFWVTVWGLWWIQSLVSLKAYKKTCSCRGQTGIG